jgi:hypothetical protein
MEFANTQFIRRQFTVKFAIERRMGDEKDECYLRRKKKRIPKTSHEEEPNVLVGVAPSHTQLDSQILGLLICPLYRQ